MPNKTFCEINGQTEEYDTHMYTSINLAIFNYISDIHIDITDVYNFKIIWQDFISKCYGIN